MDRCLFSSATDQWATPSWLVDECARIWGPFDLDPAADSANHKAPRYYTAQDDGLHKPWSGRTFCNPPYGAGLGAWVERMAKAADLGEVPLVCAVLPARTDTSFWHAYVMRAAEVRFLRGRVAFGDGTQGAPFPTAIVIWKGKLRATPSAPCVGWDLRAVSRGQLELLDDLDCA